MALSHPAKYLMDWFSRYIKNRDLVFRKIAAVKEEENKVVVEQKDGRVVHNYIEPFPEDFAALAAGMPEEHKGIVVYHSKQNFDGIVKAWDKLAGVKNLTIYCINPFSKLDKKWIINPRTHALVSDPESLKEGLKAMFETVDPISKEEVEKLTAP
ncbi:hypothetical protein KY362_03140 [Candidatus Woesearchaeota archaeon]|nr:hypothetical protein [Candidatus Woesearchaeota archaeon]